MRWTRKQKRKYNDYFNDEGVKAYYRELTLDLGKSQRGDNVKALLIRNELLYQALKRCFDERKTDKARRARG